MSTLSTQSTQSTLSTNLLTSELSIVIVCYPHQSEGPTALTDSEPVGVTSPPLPLSAVLSTALDLVDLSELGESSGGSNKERRRSPLRKKGSSKSPRRRAKPEETELIQVQVEHLPASPRTPERISLDSGESQRAA